MHFFNYRIPKEFPIIKKPTAPAYHQAAIGNPFFPYQSRHKKSTRRDSNPRPSPWQGDTPPLSHSCILLFFKSEPLFNCHWKSTRRDSNPRPSPWQGDTPPLSHSCILCSLNQNNIHYTDEKHFCQHFFIFFILYYYLEYLQHPGASTSPGCTYHLITLHVFFFTKFCHYN